VFIGDDGFVHSFTRWMPNGDPGKILNALANVFDTDIISEYEPQYWGFDTQEEWDAAMERFAAENHMAQIARTLVKKDPTLALPENKDKLRSEVELIFDLGFC
jgi:hypothetical protein